METKAADSDAADDGEDDDVDIGDTPPAASKKTQWDITDDCTGQVHERARRHIPMYVRAFRLRLLLLHCPSRLTPPPSPLSGT